MCSPPGQYLKRIGRNGHFKRVMLGRPGNIKATLVGHFHHIEGVTFDGGHADLWREAFHIDGKMKFHRFGMRAMTSGYLTNNCAARGGRGSVAGRSMSALLPFSFRDEALWRESKR